MSKLIITLVLVLLLTLATTASAFAAHEGTRGEEQECNGITVAEDQIGDTPYCND